MTGDTVDRTHSTIFHFTKQPRYFAAMDEVREPQLDPMRRNDHIEQMGRGRAATGDSIPSWGMVAREYNSLGKLPGSVWNLTWEQVAERIVKGWAPGGICVECGEGRRPVVEKEYQHLRSYSKGGQRNKFANAGGEFVRAFTEDTLSCGRNEVTITGYACACPEPTAPTTDPVILIGTDCLPLGVTT